MSNLSAGFTDFYVCNLLDFCKIQSSLFGILHWLIAVIIILLVFTTVFVNGIFILSMWFFTSLQTPSNFLFLSLAVANFTLGTMSVLSSGISNVVFFQCSKLVCFTHNLYIFFAGMNMALTMTTFSTISIERGICVFCALRWSEIVTKRRVAIVVVVVWMFWVGLTCVLRALNLWLVYERIYLVQFGINIVISFTVNMKIFKEVRRHEGQIAAQEQVVATPVEIRKAREKKRAKTFFLMIALIMMCYIPTLVMVSLMNVRSISEAHIRIGWLFCRAIYLSHCTFDILVYGLKTEEVKTSFKKILNRLST